MTETTAEDLREDYLARLDEAMRGLPHGVAADIRGGIAEELHGLDASSTAARIAQLGDPVAIAREAQDETPAGPTFVVAAPVPAPEAPRRPTTSTRGFAITAALTLSFGGIVLPVVGWFVGAVLVCLSTLWKAWEKVVAIVVPFSVFVLTAILITTVQGFSVATAGGSSSGTGVESSANNPLLPAWYDFIWFGVIALGLVLIPASGLWLLWRLRGRATR